MARGKAISVKIRKEKVINALEVKLATVKTDKANEKVNEEKYEKAKEKWQKDLIKIATARFAEAKDVRVNYRSWNSTLNVDFDLTMSEKDIPKEPEREGNVMHDHTYKEIVEEIENAIRILQMSDEEVINTSTYNSIARYL
jgi:transposase